MSMNWRDKDEVRVGWVGRPELGTLACEVLKRDRTNDEPHGVRVVRWAKGKPSKVAWCGSERGYVFLS